MRWQIKLAYKEVSESILIFIAWCLPRRVVAWAFIRVWAHATTGDYSSEDATALLAVDALRRWDKRK